MATENRLVTVTYRLYATDADGNTTVAEEATLHHPFKFITGFGTAMESFEQRVKDLHEGDKFDFTLSPEEAYGDYDEAHVIEIDKASFNPDGHFNPADFPVGQYLTLINDDGMRFLGQIVEIKEETVRIDLNDALAGKTLHYIGTVIGNKPATNKEIEGMINLLSGECSCGCQHEGNEQGHHHCGHDHGGHCGCGHHHNH